MVASTPLFSDLSAEDIDAIARRGVVKSFPKHAIVINEGDRSDFLYVIKEGQVKVYVSDDRGKELILNIPRTASVMTLKPSRMVFVSRSNFESCLVDCPALALKLLRSLTRRVCALTDVVKNLALNDVYGRVARTLLKLAKERDGVLVVEQRLTHQDIADMVGASREMVSRIMKDLTTGGYIQSRNKIITIRAKLPRAW
jgi:CRP/FNR family cyclic AMP-dependent transcriptional regulator